jgi:hypothetical protein
MKYLITGVTILIWVCVVAGMGASAADTGTVTTTVTATVYSVLVQDGDVTYGTVALSATDDTTTGGEDEQQHAGNNGSVTETLNIQGSNSSPDFWSLVTTTPTGDEYRHRFATQAAVPYTWKGLTTAYQTLEASIANSATQDFHLEVMMSDDTSVTAQQTINVTVQATSP